jgi:hypothetical protein
MISALHWGEVAGITHKIHGQAGMDLALSRLNAFGFQLVPASPDRAVRASLIKLRRKIPYIDAFGVELATGSPEHVLVTADFDLKPCAPDIKVEFLPTK